MLRITCNINFAQLLSPRFDACTCIGSGKAEEVATVFGMNGT